jgi:hypothetical protein
MGNFSSFRESPFSCERGGNFNIRETIQGTEIFHKVNVNKTVIMKNNQ